MPAIVGGKRSFVENVESSVTNYKKFRFSSPTPPARFNYSPPVHQSPVDQLKALFPDMELQILERALEESGNDIESAIKSLHELHLGYSKKSSASKGEENENVARGATPTGEDAVPTQKPQIQNNLPVNGAEWVDLLVSEMTKSSSIDDAKFRASSILENLEKSLYARASTEEANLHKENAMLKEQMEVLVRENVVLKRAVAIQHERQKEYDERNQEVQTLKQMVTQYQERSRNLELNNYALTLHLQQAQQNRPLSGNYHPDVF